MNQVKVEQHQTEQVKEHQAEVKQHQPAEEQSLCGGKSRLFTFWVNLNTNMYVIFNGQDTNHPPTKFERGWEKSGVVHYDEDTGFLQELIPISKACFNLILEEDEEDEEGEEVKEGILYYHKLPNEGIHTHPYPRVLPIVDLTGGVYCWCFEVEDVVHFFQNPICLPVALINYAKSARLQHNYNECLDFILTSVSQDLMEMSCLRNESEISISSRKTLLFNCATSLMMYLQAQDKENINCLRLNHTDKIDFASVLWFVYTYTNHALFTKHKDIGRYNEQLVEYFIKEGLKNQLLAIAISGERERYLDNHQRSYHDILYESEEVVKALVPNYISGNDIICQDMDNNGILTLNPIQYWHYFDETLFNVCSLLNETFEKNQSILEYLKLHE
jgi:hypothetical protein